jgi:phosphoserine phosphatase
MTEPRVLPGWRDGPARSAILEFVESVTRPGDAFVPPPDRVATLDNDGTLWCEKPLYPQADFIFRRWKAMIHADPELANEQPYKALAEGDFAWLGDMYAHVPELVKGVTAAHEGITVEAFEAAVLEFFSSARHPTLATPYTDVTYRPMRELIGFLQAHGFTVYICSAGGRDFVRPVAERLYGVPRECVIGSSASLEYRDGELYRTATIEQPIDDGPGKPVHIWSRTGRKALLAGGNADGDVPMLDTARFGLLVRHDDAEREFAYDSGAEQAVAAAHERGWTIVSMKDDFRWVF